MNEFEKRPRTSANPDQEAEELEARAAARYGFNHPQKLHQTESQGSSRLINKPEDPTRMLGEQGITTNDT